MDRHEAEMTFHCYLQQESSIFLLLTNFAAISSLTLCSWKNEIGFLLPHTWYVETFMSHQGFKFFPFVPAFKRETRDQNQFWKENIYTKCYYLWLVSKLRRLSCWCIASNFMYFYFICEKFDETFFLYNKTKLSHRRNFVEVEKNRLWSSFRLQ